MKMMKNTLIVNTKKRRNKKNINDNEKKIEKKN